MSRSRTKGALAAVANGVALAAPGATAPAPTAAGAAAAAASLTVAAAAATPTPTPATATNAATAGLLLAAGAHHHAAQSALVSLPHHHPLQHHHLAHAHATAVPSYATSPFLMQTPSSHMLVHVLRLASGADLHGSLQEFLRVHRAEAATLLSAVGSLTHVNIRFANVPDELVKPQPVAHYEIVSLTGTLSLSSGNHLHMAVSDSKGQTIGGHLMPTGNLVFTTVEIVIGVLPGLLFKREVDPTFGFQELVVYPANKLGPLSFLSPDMSMHGPFSPMPSMQPQMQPVPTLKRKAEEDVKPVVANATAKKAKNVKVKKEAGEEKEEKAGKLAKLNPSVLTLASMPLVIPSGGPLASPGASSPSPAGVGGSTSPTGAGPLSSPKKPQAQLWTPAQFSVFLKSLKLDHLVPIFQWNKVDAKQFLELKLTDIRDRLGIRDPADVANVLNCINILRGSTTEAATPKAAPATATATSPAPATAATATPTPATTTTATVPATTPVASTSTTATATAATTAATTAAATATKAK